RREAQGPGRMAHVVGRRWAVPESSQALGGGHWALGRYLLAAERWALEFQLGANAARRDRARFLRPACPRISRTRDAAFRCRPGRGGGRRNTSPQRRGETPPRHEETSFSDVWR